MVEFWISESALAAESVLAVVSEVATMSLDFVTLVDSGVVSTTAECVAAVDAVVAQDSISAENESVMGKIAVDSNGFMVLDGMDETFSGTSVQNI